MSVITRLGPLKLYNIMHRIAPFPPALPAVAAHPHTAATVRIVVELTSDHSQIVEWEEYLRRNLQYIHSQYRNNDQAGYLGLIGPFGSYSVA